MDRPSWLIKARAIRHGEVDFQCVGNKYEDLIADNKIPYELNRRLSLRMFEPGIVLEGGRSKSTEPAPC